MLRFKKYLAPIILFTLVLSVIFLSFKTLADFIVAYDHFIMAFGLVVLLMAVLVQRKQAAILLENERLYCELQLKQGHIDRDMAMARIVQQGILNEPLPAVKGLRIASFCLPAQEIGGDFYGVKKRDHKVHFFVGDVSGHGITSALLMSETNSLLKELIKTENTPADILNSLNQALYRFLSNNINFVTLFYGVLDLKNKKLSYSSAGHHPGLLFRKGQSEPLRLEAKGTMLGSFKQNRYSNKNLNLCKGDKLFIYTDGIIESRTAEGKELGEENLISIIKKNRHSSAEILKDTIYEAVAKKVKNIKDDISLLILEA